MSFNFSTILFTSSCGGSSGLGGRILGGILSFNTTFAGAATGAGGAGCGGTMFFFLQPHANVVSIN